MAQVIQEMKMLKLQNETQLYVIMRLIGKNPEEYLNELESEIKNGSYMKMLNEESKKRIKEIEDKKKEKKNE